MTVLYDVKPLMTYLSLDPEITSRVGTRIYGNEIPNSEADNMPRHLILVNPAGTARVDRSRLNVALRLFDFRCYGPSMYESAYLFLLVARRLKLMERNLSEGVLLYDATQLTGRFTSREPDTEWPVSYGSFQIFLSEEG